MARDGVGAEAGADEAGVRIAAIACGASDSAPGRHSVMLAFCRFKRSAAALACSAAAFLAATISAAALSAASSRAQTSAACSAVA